MRIVEHTTEFQLEGRSAVAIGKFDGVHLGHQKLLQKIIERKEKGCLATVFTFDTSAAAFFGADEQELTTIEEKRKIFEEMGVDVLIEFPLNKETAATEPEEFVQRYLVRQMHAEYICAGADVSFGRYGAGNYELLAGYAADGGYRVELIDKVRIDGEEVSSTVIREDVRAGRMERAADMLGMSYRVSGLVEHGQRLGRTFGMPTANMIPEPDKLLPPNGVYYSEVIVGEAVYKGITNIGCKPTVEDGNVIGVETYLYDFGEDLYGREITVCLLAFRRPEKKFDSVDGLKAQLAQDLTAGMAYHAIGACQSTTFPIK